VPEALATPQGRDNDRHQPAAGTRTIESEACVVTTLDLLQNLTVAAILVCITVFIQVTATLLVLKLFSSLTVRGEPHPSYWVRALTLTSMILIIILDHLVQIHLWGSTFYLLSYFPDFWTSQYFATQTYTTLGYGNILLPPKHRMLAGWLALTGLLMIGWSTALFAYLIAKHHDAHMVSDSRPIGERPSARMPGPQ
jgi:hypothetical protein